MTAQDLLPALRELSRAEKQHILHILAADLDTEPGPLLVPGAAYPIWSPTETPDAARALLAALDTDTIPAE